MNKNVSKLIKYSLIINILLTIIKLVFGILGNSFSLTIDGVNSFIDIGISFLLLISLNIATKKPDADHPYGHEKYEVVVSFVLGIFLIITSFIIMFTSIVSFNKTNDIEKYTLIVASISIVLKVIIFSLSRHGYYKYQQISLKAESYNHLGDILATTASLVGVAISIYTSFKFFDYIAAIIIGIIIFINGIKVIKESIAFLVDESPSEDFNKEIINFILSIEGVINVDDYKSRMHVNKVYVDVEISVNKELTLIKAHEIAEHVHNRVEENFKEVIHCMVHVNPYNEKTKKKEV